MGPILWLWKVDKKVRITKLTKRVMGTKCLAILFYINLNAEAVLLSQKLDILH